MAAESGERRAVAVKGAAPQPEQQEHLPCPRCDSTNTKFCYYNNYNFSQPRHFCKSCRRYWTQGGTLRDIPVGGATRKTAKRSRTLPPPPPPPPAHFTTQAVPSTFTSLLTSSPALLALGGLGPAFDDAAFGRALWAFPEVAYIHTTSGVDAATSGGWQLEIGGEQQTAAAAAAAAGFGVGVGNNGDCFPSWPELAISTPGIGIGIGIGNVLTLN